MLNYRSFMDSVRGTDSAVDTVLVAYCGYMFDIPTKS